jgi:hypothetical protein
VLKREKNMKIYTLIVLCMGMLVSMEWASADEGVAVLQKEVVVPQQLSVITDQITTVLQGVLSRLNLVGQKLDVLDAIIKKMNEKNVNDVQRLSYLVQAVDFVGLPLADSFIELASPTLKIIKALATIIFAVSPSNTFANQVRLFLDDLELVLPGAKKTFKAIQEALPAVTSMLEKFGGKVEVPPASYRLVQIPGVLGTQVPLLLQKQSEIEAAVKKAQIRGDVKAVDR